MAEGADIKVEIQEASLIETKGHRPKPSVKLTSQEIAQIESKLKDYETYLRNQEPLELPRIDVTFKNLSFKVQVPKKDRAVPTVPSNYRNAIKDVIKKFKGVNANKYTTFYAMDESSGVIKSGTMTLVLAPPGHGKSTFLKALGNKLEETKYLTGDVYYNGKTIQENNDTGVIDAKLVGYVGQTDTHLPLITVRETLQFADENSMVDPSQTAPSLAGVNKVSLLLKVLGLKECENTIVGNPLIRGVSGGQKRRVTIGEVLMTNARLLLLDEVTTGLDAAVAYEIMKAIQTWTKISHGTVVASLLQPTPEIFELFDEVILIRLGRIVYKGPIGPDGVHIRTYFNSLGIPVADDMDLADFLEEFLTSPSHVYHRTVFDQKVEKSLKEKEKEKENTVEEKEKAAEEKEKVKIEEDSEEALPPLSTYALKQAWQTEQKKHNLEPQGDGVKLSNDYTRRQYGQLYVHPYGQHLKFNLKRQLTLMSRNKPLLIPRVMQGIVMGLIIGSLFYQLALTDIQSKIGLLLFSGMYMSFGNMAEVPISIESKRVIQKQLGYGFYPVSTYVLAVIIAHMPVLVGENFLFGSIVYWMTGLVKHGSNYLFYIFMLFCNGLCMSTYFRFLSYSAPIVEVAQIRAGPSIGIFLLFGGFLIAYEKIQIWQIEFFWLSPFSWLLRSLAQNEFGADQYDTVIKSVDGSNIRQGDSFLDALDISTNYTYMWFGALYLVCLFFLFIFLGYRSLPIRFYVPSGSKVVIHEEHEPRKVLQHSGYTKGSAQEGVEMQPLNTQQTKSTINTTTRGSQVESEPERGGLLGKGETSLSSSQPLPSFGSRLYTASFGPKYFWVSIFFYILIGFGILLLAFGNQGAMCPKDCIHSPCLGFRNTTKRSFDSNGDFTYPCLCGNSCGFDKPYDEALIIPGSLFLAFSGMWLFYVLGNAWWCWDFPTGIGYSPNTARTELPFDEVTLVFQDLEYEVLVANPALAAKRAAGTPKPPKMIRRPLLRGITAYAKPRELTALMGASGAGKTTLLDVLSGRTTGGWHKGQILVNGTLKDQNTFRRIMGYVEQADLHIGLCTVREALRFSAKLRLPTSVSEEARYRFVEEVLNDLELTALADSIIGVPEAQIPGLSAGQLKRVTIGVELVANPSILFLDEPTSGLDSREAVQVVEVIRKIAEKGRTVVCTIHQPSAEVFFKFDKLLLLQTGGHQVYFGEVGTHGTDIKHYFQSIQPQKCPHRANPATWMLDLLVTEFDQDGNLAKSHYGELYRASELSQKNVEESKRLGSIKSGSITEKTYCGSWTQYAEVQYRHFTAHYRNVPMNVKRINVLTGLGFVFGLVYLQIPTNDESGVLSKVAAIFMTSVFNGVIHANTGMPVMIRERAVYYRERSTNMYASWIYSLSIGIVEIPYVLFCSFCFLIPFYNLVGLESTAEKFFAYYFGHNLVALCFVYWEQVLSEAMPNVLVANILQGTCISLLFLFGGIFIPANSIPQGWVWFYKGINWVPKGVRLLALPQFEDNYNTIYVYERQRVETIRDFVAHYVSGYYDTAWYNALWLIITLIILRILVAICLRFIHHIKR